MVKLGGGNRWLILSQYYPPEIGAPQIRLRSAAKEMQRHGIKVEVLTAVPNYPSGKIFPGYSGRWKIKETIDDVPVTRIWVYAGTGRSAPIRLANYLSFTLTALFAALMGPRPDVMLVESQPLSLGVIAVLMKWFRKVPYIYNVPDLQVDVARQMGFMKNWAFLKLAFHLENLFLRQAWKVSTVTQRFIDHFQERGLSREHITFLPNGADTDFLQPQAPSQRLLDRWHLRGKKVFLYVGTHAYYHGLDTLIEAAALLRNCSDIVFLLVGEGPERARLMRMTQDHRLANVVFANSPYEEMDQLYSIAYASIATLRNIEVASAMRLSKIFPSLSCGVPVIYSGFGEAAELLTANQCGVTVEPEKPDLLARAIEGLASQPSLRASLGQSGRSLVVKQYSWSAIVERWLAEIGLLSSQTISQARITSDEVQTNPKAKLAMR
jgi:glycosyltransferase involved in cell wall biosynthesis